MEKYSIELWSRTGFMLADISAYVQNFKYSMQRNEAEQLSFDISLNTYEELCASIGAFPTSILSPYQTDVKVKRKGEYLFGTHVGYVNTVATEDDMVIQVRAFGYLNLLIDRYVTNDYIQDDATNIAWDLIDQTQSQTNGDLGITLGPNQAETVDRDRSYVRQNVKEGIINLTDLVDGNFDVEITHDRLFNTYTMIGTDRSGDLEFVYPGNIVSFEVPREGTALFNKIYGIGSGFGEEAITSTQGDNDSQLNFGVHEKIITWNSIVNQDTLDENTAAQVDRRKGILEIPRMSVNGEDFDLNTYGIGDRIPVKIEGHPFLATVDGNYRVERIEVDVDENEAEMITPFFDNYGLSEEV